MVPKSHLSVPLLGLRGVRGGEAQAARLARAESCAGLLIQDDVDNLALVLLHVIQQVFFAGRFETTDTAAEE